MIALYHHSGTHGNPSIVLVLILFFHCLTISAMCKPDTPSQTTTPADSTVAPSVTNQKWVLAKRPNGVFHPTEDVQLVKEDLEFDKVADDEIIVETSVLSVDAFIRTMLDEQAYHGSTGLGDTLMAIGYGKVVYAGPRSGRSVGSLVTGALGAQTHSKVKASQTFGLIKFPFMSQTASLGLMGLTTGLTAYTGIFYVSRRPRRGETVVVTAASGAVGSVAAQLARTTGARVIGIAGGPAKCDFLTKELQLDGAIDYKDTTRSLKEQLEETCPNGVDFVYDNVGGATLDALLDKINPQGRVIICGAVSQYSGNLNHGKVHGPSNYLKLAERGAEMKGFNVMQYITRVPFALMGMFWLYIRGKVQMKEQVENGIGSFPHAMAKMFSGGHVGKLLVKVTGGEDS